MAPKPKTVPRASRAAAPGRAGSRAAAGGAKPDGRGRSRSPEKVAASRANGQLGGRRASSLPPVVLERLGAIPTTTVTELRLWLTRASAELWMLEAAGSISGKYAARLRAGLTNIDRVMPRSDAETPTPPAPDDDADEAAPSRAREDFNDADQGIAVD